MQVKEHVERLTSIPDDKVDEVVRSFQLDGATKILREKEPDGTWTVTASFEDS